MMHIVVHVVLGVVVVVEEEVKVEVVVVIGPLANVFMNWIVVAAGLPLR
jgi:hypothetical protein